MSGLVILVTERLSPGLRGVISKWLIELNPGTYLGTLSARIRENLWNEIGTWVTNHDLGYALLIHPDANEQGFTMRSWGQTRYRVTNHYGLQAITRQHNKSQIRPGDDYYDPGW